MLSYQNEQFLWDEYHTTQSQLTTVKDNGQAHRRTTQDSRKVLETYLNYDKNASTMLTSWVLCWVILGKKQQKLMVTV